MILFKRQLDAVRQRNSKFLLLRMFVISWFGLANVSLCSKEIALTFDDSPRFATGYFDGKTRAKKLIQNLKKHQVDQVAFFSVSKRLDAEGIQRLKMYNDAGHIIANHTHSHGDFNKMTLNEYAEDFLAAHNYLKSFSNFKPWFRYPYLREGNTVIKRDSIRKLLEEHKYFNAYITLNNYDWYIESLFQAAIKKGIQIDLEKMKVFYVSIMMESIEYYHAMAIKHLGRAPKQVLLLHEMDISALFIGDLIDALREKGWKIISPETAYADKIADYKAKRIFRFNPGRLGEIAKENGQDKGLWHSSLNEKYLDDQFKQRVLLEAH